MTEGSSPSGPAGVALTPEKVAALLERAIRARQSGDLPAARALLRALAAHRPDMPQVWLALATAAETRAEQRQALERVIALDPQNPLAQRGLARFGSMPARPAASPPAPPEAPATPAPAEVVAVGAAPALTPTTLTPEERARTIRWPLYVVVGVAALVVLLAAWWLSRTPAAPPDTPAPTAVLPGSAIEQPTLAPAASPALATAAPATAVPATSAPPPTSTPLPPTPTVPALAIGQVVQSGSWHVALLRPTDALPIEGSIGTIQPQGRFVLALLAIGNDGAAAARIPADLVVLADAAGNRYTAQAQLSTAYLAAYGRGQRGDLGMEDELPADGSNKSVPLIFDVPQTARGLTLLVKGTPDGWPVTQ